MNQQASSASAGLNERFLQIQKWVAEGQYESALRDCRELAKLPAARVAAKGMEALALSFMDDASSAAEVLSTLPPASEIKQSEVLVTLGSAWFKVGALPKALPYFQAALAVRPDHVLAHARLGACLLAAGSTQAALTHLQAAHSAMPDSSGASLNLARAYLELGEAERALLVLPEKVVSDDPEGELLMATRADALFAAGQPEAAKVILRDLATVASPAGIESLVNTLSSKGEHEEAADLLREALDKYPDSVALWALMSELARVRGHHGEAARALQRALDMKPDSAALWAQLATLSDHRLVNVNAQEAADKALALTAGQSGGVRAQALAAKAHVQADLDQTSEAEATYRAALAEAPDYPRALSGLGQLLMQVGRVEEATEVFERLKVVAPMMGWNQLIHARQVPEDPAVLSQMEVAARRPSMEGPVKAHLLFSLASAWEKKGDADKAWALATEANEATKALLHYQPEEHRDRIEREMARFSAAFMASRAGYGNPSEVPVFVLGMPRSGTTLVEQILGSHSQIFGAGELSLIPQQIQKLEAWEMNLGTGRRYPECVDDMTQEESKRFADKLLTELRTYAPDAQRIVDKLPHNFEHVGLIKLLFPNARILHLKREPRDVAMSNYFIDYGAKFGGMGFAYDLTWIGEQLVDHQRLMAHWHDVFPGQILEVDYDALVDDVDGWAHRIIDFLGLAWEPGVLAFQSLDRAVKTASVWQVRQPVYTTSKAKWKKYEAHLAPLEAALAQVPASPQAWPVPARQPGLFLDAMAALRKGQAQEAESLFARLLEEQPRHAAAMHFRGAACFQQGKLDDAATWMGRSLRFHRGHRSWAENLIKVEEARGRTEQVQRLRQMLAGKQPLSEVLPAESADLL